MLDVLVAASLANCAPDAVQPTFARFIVAARKGDRALLESLTHPEFMQHHGYGLAESRAAWLAGQGMSRAAAETDFLERGTSVRVAGQTAVRSSVVRLRRPNRGLDTWTRSTAVLTCTPSGWRLLELESAVLHEGPLLDVTPDPDWAGIYRAPNGDRWEVRDQGGMFVLLSSDGREVPLIPLASDRFVAGIGSTLSLVREAGEKMIERRFGGRLAWRAAGTE